MIDASPGSGGREGVRQKGEKSEKGELFLSDIHLILNQITISFG
jgi:hypothetical protein